MRIYIKDLKNHVGKEVSIKGWVDVRRDQGKMVFLDIRDMTGKVQAVVLPNNEDALKIAQMLRSEWVVSLSGKVNKRPNKNIKKVVLNGEIELETKDIEVLNAVDHLPFSIDTDGYEINEEVRLTHKYLDQRRDRVQKNIRIRHKVLKHIRDFLDRENFVEIETPILTNPTPEGSRSYIVPSRLWPGNFYALPQSPQQYKQLIMSGGFEKYFQIAKCMRDEDTRGDRQPEFTQLDLEMSFVERKEVMRINEDLIISIIKDLFPNKKIKTSPFPVIPYKEVMEKYGSDKPDLREDKNNKDELAFCWIIDFPFFEKTGKDNFDQTGEWTFTHNPFSKPKDEFMDSLMHKKNISNILTTQYDLVCNGCEIAGGSIRNHNPEALKKVFEIMGYSEERILQNFGHMLRAFSSGTPPHGGIAWGFDRFLMVLLDEPNIREVIAFPKTGEGKDLLINAPSPTTSKHLKELGIEIKKK